MVEIFKIEIFYAGKHYKKKLYDSREAFVKFYRYHDKNRFLPKMTLEAYRYVPNEWILLSHGELATMGAI